MPGPDPPAAPDETEPQETGSPPAAPESAAEAAPPESAPRRTPCLLLALVGLVAGGVVALALFVLAPQPDAHKLFDQMLAAYRGSASVHARGKLVTEITMGKAASKTESPFELSYQRPNLLRLASGQGLQAVTMVSNGKHVFMELSFMRKVLRMPAAPTVSDLPGGFGQSLGANRPGMDLIALVDGRQHGEGLEVVSGTPAADKWLSSVPAPPRTWTITVTDPKGLTTALWLDRRSHAVRQSAAEVSMVEQLTEEQRKLLEDSARGDQMKAVLEQFAQHKAKVIMRFEVAELGAAIPPQTFAYQPPSGFSVIEGTSPTDAARRLMMGGGGAGGGPATGGAAPTGRKPALPAH